jgi:hypothetical protein
MIKVVFIYSVNLFENEILALIYPFYRLGKVYIYNYAQNHKYKISSEREN